MILFIKFKDYDDSRYSLQVLESLFEFVRKTEVYVSMSLLTHFERITISFINSIKEITPVIIIPSTKRSIFMKSNVMIAAPTANWPH
ncbi:MAG: hypothetical protein WA932_06730 [Nitrososphaeraceae archaeon]